MKQLSLMVPVSFFLGMVGGLFGVTAPPGWAQPAGDVGSAECGQVQLAAQTAVGGGGPYKNRGQVVRTAANVVSPAAAAGTITKACASCIMNQFARGIPVAQQQPCGVLCGDGIVQGSEQCDPPGSTCDAAGRICAGDCTCPAPFCGDNIVDPGEDCDPPDSTCDADGRICAGDCTCPAPSCGDNIVDPGEDCDPPGAPGVPSPGCESFEFCNQFCSCEFFD